MKLFILVFTTLAVLLVAYAGEARELASSDQVTCEYRSGKDIHIKVTAPTKIAAREKASHLCFDQHMALIDQVGRDISFDQGEEIALHCTNICD